MLETLHHIVHQVNRAPNLEAALAIIVRSVQQAVRSAACSVYLADQERGEFLLMATEGLDKSSVGKVKLAFGKGLIGLVRERAEPLNLDDGSQHPRYFFVAETGERRFRGFLGVPIIQNGQVLGVLVVRREEARRFSDFEVTFLFTLAAQLAGAITHARASGELAKLQGREALESHFFEGQAAASGVAIGQVVVVYPPADLDAVPDRPAKDLAAEELAFRIAVDQVADDLAHLSAQLEQSLPPEERALFDALCLMLQSDTLIEGTIKHIRAGNWAHGALRQTIDEHVAIFDAMEDEYFRERASDIRDLGRRVLTRLQNSQVLILDYPERTILVGEEVSAIQLAEVPAGRLAGLVAATGAGSSHVAILARGMGVPAVMGIADLPAGQMHGLEVIVDGYRGRVHLAPSAALREEYQRVAEADQALSRELEPLRGLPPQTLDGVDLPLFLNTGLVSEHHFIGMEESSGVGLYRTELPFMVRDSFPPEAEQQANYRQILENFAPRPVTVRTLDIGGDKPLPYFPFSESNPFLGWRGIRISLDHPEIFITQIRAMLAANVGLGTLRILLPMISTVTEVDEALALIHRVADELREEGLDIKLPPVGAMVEVPAAVYQAESLARRVDFLSVGTNDLTQYLLAVDRNNPKVSELYDDLHPAVLRALRQVVDGAKRHDREVSVCGELAGNPLGVLVLLGLGVDSLSMSATRLLPVKSVVRGFTRTQARKLVAAALECESPAQVRALLTGALRHQGLGNLLRPGV